MNAEDRVLWEREFRARRDDTGDPDRLADMRHLELYDHETETEEAR